jgi:CheY-like chemotaxis protein
VPELPDLRCFPSADRTFAGEVVALVDELNAEGPLEPATVELAIRRRFPEAVVRPQDPLASLNGRPTWYVYRRPPMADVGDATGIGRTSGADDDPTSESYGDIPVYAPSVVAQMIGVPLAVLVGWDERDRLVRPTIEHGRRMYSRNQVEELRRLKRDVAAGRTSQAANQGERETTEAPAPSRGHDRRHVAVLVAERDPFAAEFVEFLLRTEGYDVTVAYGSAEAESRVGADEPDLAIIETLLPDGGALELCARLAAKGVPVIAVASVDGESDALRAGAGAFLTKPLQPLRLLSAVRDLLGDSAFVRDVLRDTG